jgi:hypothetical protein
MASGLEVASRDRAAPRPVKVSFPFSPQTRLHLVVRLGRKAIAKPVATGGGAEVELRRRKLLSQ